MLYSYRHKGGLLQDKLGNTLLNGRVLNVEFRYIMIAVCTFCGRNQIFRIRKLILVIPLLLFFFSGAAQITSISASNIPIFIIDPGGAEIVNDPKVSAAFKISASDVDGLYSYTIGGENVYQYEGTIGIEIRGNTSILWPKKSYGFETRNPVTSGAIDVALLGLPAESDWVLNACYGDKSFIREVLAQEMFRKTGRYAPRTKYVELFLNTGEELEYMGLYVLMEKIKRGKNRVDIKKLEEIDTGALKISGGYILQIGEDEDMKWTSGISPNNDDDNPKPVFHVEYPKLHNYTNEENKTAQFNYIQSFVNDFETTLNGPDPNNGTTGYRKYLDVSSMVDYLLLQEFTKNSDNWRASTFFYKKRDDEGGLLHLGPPWDFDKSMGNHQWCYELSVLPAGSWAWEFNTYCTDRPPFTVSWPGIILNDCSFLDQVISRYRELRQNEWSNISVTNFLETQRALLQSKDAIARNFTRWPILGTGIMYNEHYSLDDNSYQKEVDYLMSWILQHLVWMDNNIADISNMICSTLPVTFKSFETNRRENNVVVSWSTTTEQRSAFFEIQRSSDARIFLPIGRVEALGESSAPASYEFTDEKPGPGINYYRIKQVDLDGKSSLTGIRRAEFAMNIKPPVLYPNPATGMIRVENLQSGSAIRVIDVHGRTVDSISTTGSSCNLPVGNYLNQVYYLIIDDGQKVKTFSFLIQK